MLIGTADERKIFLSDFLITTFSQQPGLANLYIFGKGLIAKGLIVNIIQLFHTFLCNSQNYHPRGAVDDPMHCCPRPKAEGNSASGHPQHRGGDSFDCCTERNEIVVLLPNSEDTSYWKYFLKFE